MRKKLLFTAYTLEVGGIETALINLLKRLDYSKYDVTLILEKKIGIFLEDIPKEVKVLEYKVCDDKNVLVRKIKNRLHLLSWQRKLKNKFDFAVSFATYSIPGAYLALSASKNNYLWIHSNYYVLYDNDEKRMQEFLDTVFIKRFKHIVFVSNENKRDVCNHYDGIKDKSIVCNNFINGLDILEKSKEKIDYKKDESPLFVNIGRHEEHQKRLTRIIEASKDLVKEGYKFKILFIGDGPDNEMYKNLVKKYKLQDVIIFLGRKKNPFPYYKICDAVVLSSDCEGYPVVFLEAMTINKPILSTKISDWEDLDNKNGLFCEISEEGVLNNMRKFLDEGFVIKERFDYEEYNEDILKKIVKMIDDK